jgi:cell wall-associated NlpC family hydrolase
VCDGHDEASVSCIGSICNLGLPWIWGGSADGSGFYKAGCHADYLQFDMMHQYWTALLMFTECLLWEVQRLWPG